MNAIATESSGRGAVARRFSARANSRNAFEHAPHQIHIDAWIEGDVPEEYWPDLVVLCRGLHAGHHGVMY